MKKILIVFAVFLAGCESRNVTTVATDVQINGVSIKTYIIDDCEYVGNVIGTSSDMLTHKGNCKFCAKRNKTDNN